MNPAESNRLALEVMRDILDAAKPLELNVDGHPVRVSVEAGEHPSWPLEISGVEEGTHGPWPRDVKLRCEWEGGRADMVLAVAATRRAESAVSAVIRLAPSRRKLVWTNVANILEGAEETVVPVAAYIHLKKRLDGAGGDAQMRLNHKIKALVASTGLPLVTAWAIEAFRIDHEGRRVLPSADEAFRRLVHLSLIKLDFFSQGGEAQPRGRPLIDVRALGLSDVSENGQEDESSEERRYWAGGFGEPDRLLRFLEEHAWEISWKRDEETRGAQQSWSRLDQIRVGDWFAIKGFGGSYQLQIHFVGEVIRVDTERGRLELAPLPEKKLYKGPAPRGSGAGSWFETLVAVTRDDIVELLFGDSTNVAPALSWSGPSNLILYGPPGTGKTFRLRDDIRPKFIRRSGGRELDVESLLELSWFEAILAALVDLGGEGTAKQVGEHPFVRTKYQAKDRKAPTGAQVWATLQSHTIQESTTVSYSRRVNPLVFDKREDGRWFFPAGIPEEGAELAKALQPQPAEVSEDYVFVTFHQSYAYEDFIEGIRPKTVGGDGDEGSRLVYELEPGVFLRAANAAVRLTGFEGTMDDLCRLPREARAELFEGAPLYAVFIDEINRGNVSRIFGELITLLEGDKRLGAEGELIVTLPYSRRRFGVPKNLRVVGTMNTADRSIEALDSALRRRFAFEECPPDPRVVEGVMVEGVVDVARLLRTINARLELLLDRDHLIGHAYLVPVRDEPTIERLKEVFSMSILPLLSEYFYADLGRIGLVLGPAFVRRVASHATLAAFDHEAADQLADRVIYRLAPIDGISTADFRGIYESSSG